MRLVADDGVRVGVGVGLIVRIRVRVRVRMRLVADDGIEGARHEATREGRVDEVLI